MKLPGLSLHRKSELQLRPATAKSSTNYPNSSYEPLQTPALMPKRSHSQTVLSEGSSSKDVYSENQMPPSKEPRLDEPRPLYSVVASSQIDTTCDPRRGSLLRRASNAAGGAARRTQNLFSHHSNKNVSIAAQDQMNFPDPTLLNHFPDFKEQGSDTPMHSLHNGPSPSQMPGEKESKRRTLIKNLKTMAGRRGATSGPSGEEGRWNPRPIAASPYIVDNLAGSSARASAAAHNSRHRSPESSVYGKGKSVSSDCESAVYMITGCESQSSFASLDDNVVRVDFTDKLPAELVLEVFSQLDMASLTKAESVSRTWNTFANDPYVWQKAFQARYEPRVHVTPAPIQMGGHGAGQIRPGQDWKLMAKARKTIETRWKVARPSATYFNGHTDSVYCCQFDEKKIITGSRDRTIRVWDIETGQCLKVIGGGAALPVAPTPAQQNLATEPHQTISNIPSLNGTLEGRRIFHTPPDFHDQSILCLQYDDELMVTGSSDTSCIVWDIKTFQPLARLRHHNAGVLDVCLDAKHIISCSKDATICVWDRKTLEFKKVLRGHRGPVNAVQLRGGLLVSASGDGVAKLWNLESGACIKEYQSQDRGLAAVEFSDDAKFVLAGGNDQVVYKFDAQTGEHVHTYKGHEGLVRSLFVDAPNNVVVSGSYDQSIRVYDYTTGELWGEYKNWTTSWILSAKSDYRRIVCTSQDGRSVLMDFGNKVEGVELLRGRRGSE